jgi:hypothetical protein
MKYTQLNDRRQQSLNALVAHMMSVNDLDGAVFDFAERNIIESPEFAWNTRSHPVSELYQWAKRHVAQKQHDLKRFAMELNPVHTVVPTPDMIERESMYRQAMCVDYSQSARNGWSND